MCTGCLASVGVCQVFVEPVDVFLECFIKGDLPGLWALSEGGQHPVKEQSGVCLAALSHMKELAEQHVQLMQACQRHVDALIH